jgi:ubiquinone/menaquinone biosynthesis C-methylase UbiE
MSQGTFVRKPLAQVTSGYDRMARWYRLAEPAILMPPGMRRRAVARVQLAPGSTVLEVGCGTGRNLKLLRDAVGPSGKVIGVDASAGMLARARRLIASNRWENVDLLHQDASELALDHQVDGVLFSLSYSALPSREPVLDAAWAALRSRGRLVVMDAGLPEGRLGRVLAPAGELIANVFPGDPYSQPWEDLTRISQAVVTERFQLGIYFICTVRKPDEG